MSGGWTGGDARPSIAAFPKLPNGQGTLQFTLSQHTRTGLINCLPAPDQFPQGLKPSVLCGPHRHGLKPCPTQTIY